MGKDSRRYWFPRKKRGFGWGLPVTWQGWLVLGTYLVLVILGAVGLTDDQDHFG